MKTRTSPHKSRPDALRTDHYTPEQIEAFNRIHDARYGFSPQWPRLYTRSPDRPADNADTQNDAVIS